MSRIVTFGEIMGRLTPPAALDFAAGRVVR